jgi:general secretion pathway protein G
MRQRILSRVFGTATERDESKESTKGRRLGAFATGQAVSRSSRRGKTHPVATEWRHHQERAPSPPPTVLPGVGGKRNLACNDRLAMRQTGESQCCRGFTLIELVVLVGILGLVTAVGIPVYGNQLNNSRNAKAAADIAVIQFDLRLYDSGHDGALPNTLDALGRGTIRDPWGNPYQYLNFATVHGVGQLRKDRFLVPINSTYDLYSMGKDGRSALPLTAQHSRDDIIRANDGGFIGLASDY